MDQQAPRRRLLAQWLAAAPPSAAADSSAPLVLVVEEAPVLAPRVGELCDFLRVQMEVAGTKAALETVLRDVAPVAVLCHAPRTGHTVARTLGAVAGFDPGLPVMVVTEQDASRQSRLAVAADLVRLDGLVWLDHMPDARALVSFLFTAERRAGRGQMMPV